MKIINKIVAGIVTVAALSAPSYAQECTQDEVKGDWQLQLTALNGQPGLGLRCTLRITPKGNVGSGNALTACDYALENTPTVKGSFMVTDTPAACIVDISLTISGGPSGNKAFVARTLRLNTDHDFASNLDAVLEDQDGTEIYSGPISIYKY